MPKEELGVHRMERAVVQLSPHEPLIAICTVELLQSGIDFHENFFPWYLFLPQKHYKLVNVPTPIRHVLRDHGAMKINKDFSLRTIHPLPLRLCKQSITVDTPIQNIAVFFKQQL